MYFELIRRFEDKLPTFHPIGDMEIEDKRLTDLIKAQKVLNSQLALPELAELPADAESQFERKNELKAEIKVLEGSIREAAEMIMRVDLVNMKRVMRRLDLADKNDVPTLKGKVACSISASDEILITELIFSGELQDLEPHQVASLLSCLIYTDHKSAKEKEGENKFECKDPVLAKAFASLQNTAGRVAATMVECKIEKLDKEEYVDKFRPDMMELTQQWC